jgi:excisionase family DNA binding protein
VETNELLTLDEVAAYVRVHRNTVYRWVRTGQLPALQVGATWRVRRSDIDAMTAPSGGAA